MNVASVIYYRKVFQNLEYQLGQSWCLLNNITTNFQTRESKVIYNNKTKIFVQAFLNKLKSWGHKLKEKTTNKMCIKIYCKIL